MRVLSTTSAKVATGSEEIKSDAATTGTGAAATTPINFDVDAADTRLGIAAHRPFPLDLAKMAASPPPSGAPVVWVADLGSTLRIQPLPPASASDETQAKAKQGAKGQKTQGALDEKIDDGKKLDARNASKEELPGDARHHAIDKARTREGPNKPEGHGAERHGETRPGGHDRGDRESAGNRKADARSNVRAALEGGDPREARDGFGKAGAAGTREAAIGESRAGRGNMGGARGSRPGDTSTPTSSSSGGNGGSSVRNPRNSRLMTPGDDESSVTAGVQGDFDGNVKLYVKGSATAGDVDMSGSITVDPSNGQVEASIRASMSVAGIDLNGKVTGSTGPNGTTGDVAVNGVSPNDVAGAATSAAQAIVGKPATLPTTPPQPATTTPANGGTDTGGGDTTATDPPADDPDDTRPDPESDGGGARLAPLGAPHDGHTDPGPEPKRPQGSGQVGAPNNGFTDPAPEDDSPHAGGSAGGNGGTKSGPDPRLVNPGRNKSAQRKRATPPRSG